MILAGWCLLAAAAENKVVVSENDTSFSLDNGIVCARVSKLSGNLISLTYKQLEMLDVGGHFPGYWSHDTSRGSRTTRITIDPSGNGGQFGEVSVKGVFNGSRMGGRTGGAAAVDIETRYALAAGDSAIYAYCVFEHQTNYPATGIGEARFCAKLNDAIFDWMTVDSNRNMQVITAYDWDHGTPMNMPEARRMETGKYKGLVEHKYDYTANQFDVRTWGWSSSKKDVGIYFINPSVEYLSGGPTKFELCAHRDATFTDDLDAPAPPCLLNYWRSSHYGGAVCSVGTNEAWTKVIGPFLIYCNSAQSPDAMWHAALARGAKEEQVWPYDWVAGVDYPNKRQRATVAGKIVLNDPQASGARMKNLLVGLTAPDYLPRFTQSFFRFGRANFGPPHAVDWQSDAKYYQFWVRANDDGSFQIPNVRPGTYTLRAIADGVLGELDVTNIVVASETNLSLANIHWQPVRYGKQLWDIGVPNRNGSEFFKGDDYFHWGWYLQYPKLFPNDVNYTVGQSDFRKDWFFEQVPHEEDLKDTDGTGRGRNTTWSVHFNLLEAPAGRGVLRLAICGSGTREIAVDVNDHPAGTVSNLVYNATINRDGIEGAWSEHDLTFDASLMQAGTNVMQLTIPGGGLTSGVMYDYIRLELAPPATLLSKNRTTTP